MKTTGSLADKRIERDSPEATAMEGGRTAVLHGLRKALQATNGDASKLAKALLQLQSHVSDKLAKAPQREFKNLWFVQAPTDLRYITVHNSAGQLVWNKVYATGSTVNVININLAGKAAGVYMINFGYGDKSKDTQVKVIKSN